MPNPVRITLELENLNQIDFNIEAVQRIVDGLPTRIADLAPLLGTISILEQIKDSIKPTSFRHWCETHNRWADHIDSNGKAHCDPSLGGILLPCNTKPVSP